MKGKWEKPIKPLNEPFARNVMMGHGVNNFFNEMREQLKLKK